VISEILPLLITDNDHTGVAMRHSSRQGAAQGREQGRTPHQPHAPGRQGHVSASAPHPWPATEAVIGIHGRKLRGYDRVRAGEWTTTIRPAPVTRQGAQMKGDPLAYIHVSQDAPNGGRMARPPFTVTGADGELWCAVRPVGGGVYDVYGADGAAIGRITRRRGRLLPWPRRVHWTVQPASGAEPLSGKVGTGKGWTAMVLLSPLYFVCWAVMAAQGLILLLVGDKAEARKEAAWELEPPGRTRWRAAGQPDAAMEYLIGHVYRLFPTRLDHRLVCAQTVLHVWDRS
jgi:hypothetical protein